PSASNKPPGTSHAFHVLPFTSSEYGSRGARAVMFRAQSTPHRGGTETRRKSKDGKTLVLADLKVFPVPLSLRGEVLLWMPAVVVFHVYGSRILWHPPLWIMA